MAINLKVRIAIPFSALMLFWTASCSTTSAPKESLEDVPIAKPAPAKKSEDSANPRFYAIGTVPIKWADDEPVYRSVNVFKQPANLEDLIAALTAETERSEAKVLKISPAGKTPVPLTKYVVQKGDTLKSIGKAHGLTPAEIITINGLDSDEVEPGETLMLPEKN